MKITLAMPVYNVERWVEKALLSALNQTYEDIEFIVVDDCGTDGSMDIVRRVVAAHQRGGSVRIISHGVNRSLGDTRNTAINEATGDCIYFMDSDDELLPDSIERLAAYMEETPVDFVAASRERRTFGGELIASDVYKPVTVADEGRFTVMRRRYGSGLRMLNEVWNKLYSLRFLRENNIHCIPGVHVEDVSFSYQVMLNARSCRLVPDVTYIYHIYEGQSFSAFRTNHDRALYLAECFVKIRDYDLSLIQQYRDDALYPTMVLGIFGNVFLHSQMVFESKVLTAKEKRAVMASLLCYPLSLNRIMGAESGRKKHIAMWAVCKCPEIIRKIIYNRITK